MAKRKRWGKKYKDKRNWKAYNSKLVKRGEFYINPVFLDTWLDEIREMNSGKVGQPYMYPNSQIEFLGVLHAKNYDYRALEGIVHALSERLGNFPVISFSQIRRRTIQLDLRFHAKNNNLIVGGDGSGIKVTNRGDWIREVWNAKRKGWIKVVILGDTEGNIVDIRVGNEDLNERSASRGMLRNNHTNIMEYLGDGLHDNKDTFHLVNQLGIKPVIKIRDDASTNADGCLPRKKAVIEYKEKGYKKWAKDNNYGMRWVATEGIFSAVKRILGESVNSHKKRTMYHEARLKFWAYQRIRDAA